MRKMLVSLLAVMLLFNTAFAESGLPETAYGAWASDGKVFMVSERGLSLVNQAVAHEAACQAVYAYKTLSGSELIDGIYESVAAFGDFKNALAYVKEADVIIKWIDPKQNYVQMLGSVTCADGEYSFIPLNERMGVLVMTASESRYSLAKKKNGLR